MRKRVYRELCIVKKLEVIKVYEEKKLSQRKLADMFKISKSQVQRILASKDEIKDCINKFEAVSTRKRVKSCATFADIDSLTFKWFCLARQKNLPVSGTVLQHKAKQIAESLCVSNFAASNGWLEAFKTRHNIVFKMLVGEAANVDPKTIDDFKKILQKLCEGYQPQDIYNLDETALFFRATPAKTLHLKNEKCIGGKLSKERLTVALLCNSIGEKEPLLLIGKSARPRAFKNIDVEGTLGITWRNNCKSWMTTKIFKEWMEAFDRKMQRAGRKVLLFADNATCHMAGDLKNIELRFFPPNTTSHLQPLDQGIIRSLKSHYRTIFMKQLILNIDDAISASEIVKGVTILDACIWLKTAWDNVSSSVITNCFKKCGFTEWVSENDTDLSEDIPEEISLEFINIDNEVLTSEESTENWEETFFKSVENFNDDGNNNVEEPLSDDDEERYCTIPKLLSFREATVYLNDLKNFSVEKGLGDLWESLHKCSFLLAQSAIEKTNVQKKITDYFNTTN